MAYLRRGERSQFQSVLCGLTDWPDGSKPPYFQALLDGASHQARHRGYGFQLLRLSDVSVEKRLQTQLRGRGVQGVLLLPMQAPRDLGGLLDWSELSVVSASMSVLGPEVSRAVPNHFINTQRMCRELRSTGYRRIGLVMPRAHDARANHAFSAAVMSEGIQETGILVRPLLYNAVVSEVLTKWNRQERPDAIIVRDAIAVKECARLLGVSVPGRIGFAVASIDARPASLGAIAGIDEVPGQVGAAAIDLLAGLVERRVRGLPASPTSLLVSGQWNAGASCTRAKARKG